MRLQIIVFAWCLAASTSVVAADHYLFSYFKGNGEDGLHLAHSTDGIHWTALNRDRSFLTPTVDKDRLMRDPSIVRGPDGVFHMVWTTGWHDQGIGVAHSKDLIEWSEQKRVGVMDHEPGVATAGRRRSSMTRRPNSISSSGRRRSKAAFPKRRTRATTASITACTT